MDDSSVNLSRIIMLAKNSYAQEVSLSLSLLIIMWLTFKKSAVFCRRQFISYGGKTGSVLMVGYLG